MDTLQKNPGLKKEFSEIIEESWEKARREIIRSFDQFDNERDLDKAGIPKTSPLTMEQILNEEIIPEKSPDLRLPGP